MDFGAIRSISLRWYFAMLFFFRGTFIRMSFVDDDQDIIDTGFQI